MAGERHRMISRAYIGGLQTAMQVFFVQFFYLVLFVFLLPVVFTDYVIVVKDVDKVMIHDNSE